jgi:hypothetical protein
MYSIVPILNVYISYSEEAQVHIVFNGSGFYIWLGESDPYALGVILRSILWKSVK